MKFVKVSQGIDDESDSNNDGLKPLTSAKKREERERTYNVETEPDLRKDAREGEFQSYKSVVSEKNKNKGYAYYSSFMGRNAPLTERIVNEKLINSDLDSSENENIELPSPKESDALINHREADAYFENNSNDTESKGKNKEYKKSNSTYTSFPQDGTVVTIDEQTIEGHKVEDVRFHTGVTNLNSPLGRHVKIEFNQRRPVDHQADEYEEEDEEEV